VSGAPSPLPLGELPLSRASLDRAAHRRLEPDLVPKLLADPATRVVVIVAECMEILPDRSLALRPPVPDDRHRLAFFLGEGEAGDGASTAPSAELPSSTERVAYLAVVGDPTVAAGHGDWQTLRNAGPDLTGRDAGIFTTTQALANWHAAHQFCPRCGAATEPEQAGWIRRCTRDGSEHYPRTDPAVIVAVVDDDDRLLLGRNAQWPEGRFSVLAGFVEPGESFEAAVVREVEEEVGILVTDVTFLGNQPWPFPSSAMVGYRARAVTTVLNPDRVEIAEARWFTRDEYRNALISNEIRTPSGISIAQRLIENWLGHRVADVTTVSW
jgi:NAD+ diphosphatase